MISCILTYKCCLWHVVMYWEVFMKRLWRSIAAVFMAMLMVVGMLPADFTVVSVKAAEPVSSKYTAKDTFTAPTDADEQINIASKKLDEKEYFKLSADKWFYKKKKTDYIQNDKTGTISFTVSDGCTADITIEWASTGNDNTSEMQLKNEKNQTFKDSNGKENPSVTGSSKAKVEYKNLVSGNYTLGNKDNPARGFNLYSIEVVEKSAGPITGTAPVIQNAKAELKAGTTDTVNISWDITTPAAGDGAIEVVVYKTGKTEAEATLSPKATDTSIEYQMKSSGEYTFEVYGKLGDNKTSSARTTGIVYTLPLSKPSVSAKTGSESGKVSLKWGEVKEATSYEVVAKIGEVVKNTVNIVPDESGKLATSYDFTGLENNTNYTFIVSAVRGGDKAESDTVTAMPYAPIDTSSAIPGLKIVNQSTDNTVSISRTGGSIIASQSATEGGIAKTVITNASYIAYPNKMTGDFTMSADVTMMSAPAKGLFIGAVSAIDSDKPSIAGLYIRNNSGKYELNTYRTKNASSYENGGSALTNFEIDKKYTITISRISDAISVVVKDGDKEVGSKTWPKTDLNSELANPVYAGISICGATATIENFKVTTGSTTVFDSSKLEGSFSSFVDNWSSVEAPSITVSGNRDSMVVTSDCVIGATGAGTVTVEMKDDSGNVVETKSNSVPGSKQEFTFEPTVSGDYTFVATASRPSEKTVKTSNVVKVTGFVATLKGPQGLTATSQGDGKVKVEWDAYSEATDGYRVSYKKIDDADSNYIVAKDVTKDTSYEISGLEIGTKYNFKVESLRGSEAAATVVSATATADTKYRWQFSAFGSGVDDKNNGSTGDVNDGSVTVYSLNGKGKIVPNTTDGLAFYYTQIPSSKNFTVRAKVKVDEWTFSNGQEGFGVMAMDRVGANGDSSVYWNNSYQAIASKIEYTVNSEGKLSDEGTKYSMKLGIGSIARTGVTAENMDKFINGDVSSFKTKTTTLETSAYDKGLEAGTYNIIGNSTNESVSAGLDGVTECYLTIQKNNTGYFVTYTSLDGKVSKTNKYYDPEALSQIDKDNVYVGFFASRNAKATFSDISVTLINPEDDAPAEAKPIEYVTPSYVVTSSTASGQENYKLSLISNADGVVSISGTNIKNYRIKAGLTFSADVKLTEGANTFYITVKPDNDFVPANGDKLSSYDAKVITHTVNYKKYGKTGQAIWVSASGKSDADGTNDNPLDIYTAIKYVQPGQQIILKAGTYNLSSTVKVDRGNNGTAENMITMMADPSASSRPVLDFGGNCAGMILGGDYWYFKGFDVTHSANAQKGIQVSGSHNVLDQINTYHNGNTGLQISRLLSTDVKSEWPAYNTILNCTSYGNADKGYEDADGFAAKLTVGDGNVFDGCIAYNNADDGWDLFAKVETGPIGMVTIQNCVAYGNGYLEDGTNAGNGNGFKMGGSSITGHHKLINSVSFNNKSKGIDSNSCPDIQVVNSTTFNNESFNVAFYTNDAANTDFSARGIISYRTENRTVAEQFKFKGTQDTSKVNGDSNYYWNVATNQSVNESGAAVSDKWFVSLDTAKKPTRNSDGTINMNGLLVLTDKAPANAGARLSGRSSANITVNPSVDSKPSISDDDFSDDDSSDDLLDRDNDSSSNDSYKGDNGSQVTVPVKNEAGEEVAVAEVKATADIVIKDADGKTVSLDKIVIRPEAVTVDSESAKEMLTAAENQGIKIDKDASVEYYDITLTDVDGNKLTFENGSLTITFKYPSGTDKDGYSFKILHLLKSGTVDVMDPVIGENGISVTVTELSPFAVVYAKNAANGSLGKTVSSPKTGDRAPIVPIVLVLIASGAVLGTCMVVSKKKKLNNR